MDKIPTTAADILRALDKASLDAEFVDRNLKMSVEFYTDYLRPILMAAAEAEREGDDGK